MTNKGAASVAVTAANIREGMQVRKNPHWDPKWGVEDIHPNSRAEGVVVAWSDMEGNRHGAAGQASSSQLGWEGLAIVQWTEGSEPDPWKSVQAYRIGFEGEFWLAAADHEKEQAGECEEAPVLIGQVINEGLPADPAKGAAVENLSASDIAGGDCKTA